MDLVAVGIAAFLVGGLVAGAFAWLLAAARTRAVMEVALRDAESRRAAEAARADGLGRQLADERALIEGTRVHLGDTFAAIAAESLRASQEDFLTLASERLGAVRDQTTSDAAAREAAQQQAMVAQQQVQQHVMVAQQKAIEGMVTPVRASLEKFDEQIRAMERERGTAYGELRQQMIGISATQERLRDATGSLVAALKAPAVRGRWGEMQLRRVVELAGMLEHCDFDEQTTIAGVDGRLRPDMIIHLPGGRRIVVDAKAPLGAYLEAREATDDEARAAKYRQHAAQVRSHMQKLGAKSYWDALDAAPDMVVMFLPGEPLYSVALEQMPDLMEEGQAQRVLVATPMTLIALLRTASFGWREERLAENAQRISDEGRRLHERIATVAEHFADQRVVVSARRLEELDARGKKEIASLEEIDAHAVGPQLPEKPEKPEKSERARRTLTQQPLLTLAPPPDQEG
jgi:DNA recombination protein RmuC